MYVQTKVQETCVPVFFILFPSLGCKQLEFTVKYLHKVSLLHAVRGSDIMRTYQTRGRFTNENHLVHVSCRSSLSPSIIALLGVKEQGPNSSSQVLTDGSQSEHSVVVRLPVARLPHIPLDVQRFGHSENCRPIGRSLARLKVANEL